LGFSAALSSALLVYPIEKSLSRTNFSFFYFSFSTHIIIKGLTNAVRDSIIHV